MTFFTLYLPCFTLLYFSLLSFLSFIIFRYSFHVYQLSCPYFPPLPFLAFHSFILFPYIPFAIDSFLHSSSTFFYISFSSPFPFFPFYPFLLCMSILLSFPFLHSSSNSFNISHSSPPLNFLLYSPLTNDLLPLTSIKLPSDLIPLMISKLFRFSHFSGSSSPL